MELRCIVVNAIALTGRGGAYSILKQFINHIPQNDLNWIIFVPQEFDYLPISSNIKIIKQSVSKSFIKRLSWDFSGLNKFLKNINIKPIANISLQNTGFRTIKGIPNFIYYHQSLPFYSQKWNPFKRGERTAWFYKNIYPFAVRLFLSKVTKILVQLDFIKEGFRKCFNHPEDNIKIFSPEISLPKSIKDKNLPTDKINLIYPTHDNSYKNNEMLINAVGNLGDNYNLFLTLNSNENSSNIHYLGHIPQEEIFAYYKACDALVFPSYIETFGLPLAEAAMLGVPIIAADIPYAREVLDGYNGVKFVKFDDLQGWQNAIRNLKKGQRFSPLDISKRPGWSELFSYILENIDSKSK